MGLSKARGKWKRARQRVFATINRNIKSARVVAVTGSSAKSTTAMLLGHILEGDHTVTRQAGHNGLNNAVNALRAIRFRDDFAVIEAGAGKPGDVEKIARFLQPDVAVVTMVALEHKSNFRNIDAVQHEKGALARFTKASGLVVLNGDDERVLSMGQNLRPRVLTFGRENSNVDYRVSDVTFQLPGHLRLSIEYAGTEIHLQTRFVGSHFWLPVAAAVATSLALGVTKELVSERVSNFDPIFERCGVLNVPGGPTFIVDTVKAPWHSIKLALDMLEGAAELKRRVVLGHMSDFAGSDSKYRDAYKMARSIADQVIFVGDHAHRSRATPEDIGQGKFKSFSDPREVFEYLRTTSAPGEIILLKGSSDLHLERIALGFMQHIECWDRSCGKTQACLDCKHFSSAPGRKENKNLAYRDKY